MKACPRIKHVEWFTDRETGGRIAVACDCMQGQDHDDYTGPTPGYQPAGS